MGGGDGEAACLVRVDLSSVLDGFEVDLVSARVCLGGWRLVDWRAWLVVYGSSALPVMVEVSLACGQFPCWVLVEKLVCEAGPSCEETCMDGFEPFCICGAESGSMEVPDNLPLGRAVVDAFRDMAICLLFHANIPESIDHEVLTGAWWKHPSGASVGSLIFHRPPDNGCRPWSW